MPHLEQLPNESVGSRGRRQGFFLRFASIRPHSVAPDALELPLQPDIDPLSPEVLPTHVETNQGGSCQYR